MEAYAAVLLYAIPMFVVLIIIEALYGWWKGDFTFRSMDTISSLSSGMTNTLKSVLGLVIVVVGYDWMVDKIAVTQIEATWLVYLAALIAIDFGGYWNHRLNHSINYFWNRHVVHHSSEEFNLACALRQTISNFFGIGAFFLIPAALLGVPAKVIGVIAPIHLFAQFWYHTRHIPKLGFLEYLIITPSQHRVHHAINTIYLDKNLGELFPWWDRMFGTFQEELEEEPCVYGVLKAPKTWNPIKINFQHLWVLIKDAWHTNSYWDKCRLWFMPTGWRPADVVDKYPIQIIENPHTYEKYDTVASPRLHAWSWFQFIMANVFVTHMLIQFSDIGFPQLFYYGLFVFMLIYSYTSLMDRDAHSIWFELIKSIYGMGLLFSMNGWFGLESTLPIAPTLVAAYLVISVLVVAGFVMKEFKEEARSLVAN